jgi:hypothetical protein
MFQSLHLLVSFVCLKGKLVHTTNENTMLMEDIAYLTSWLERTKLSEK